jgi:hypothetical protein
MSSLGAIVLESVIACFQLSSVQAQGPSKVNITDVTNAMEASGVTRVTVLPSVTDRAISTFDNPHYIYVNRQIVVDHKQDLAEDRHQLLLFLPGTHEKGTPRGEGPYTFLALAANLGYHVISLSYPDEVPASVCRNDDDASSFEDFRLAIIQGGESKHITVERVESIEHRLEALLHTLQQNRPREHWDEFLNSDGSPNWEKIAVSGHSQGGGHAVLIAIKHRVARVICSGSPKDHNQKHDVPAGYYWDASLTPKNRFFAFNHIQDYTGGTSPDQLMQNLKALQFDQFGESVSVDSSTAPYNHSRDLWTAIPKEDISGPQSKGSLAAHLSLVSPPFTERRKTVWTYMLTESVQ